MPFEDQTFTLGDELLTSAWDSSIATSDSDPADCGEYSLHFFVEDWETAEGSKIWDSSLEFFDKDNASKTVEYPINADTTTCHEY